MLEAGNVNREPVFCNNSRKEKQILSNCRQEEQGECRHEGQEWYENLKKNFLQWKKKNPNRATRGENRKPVALAENSSNNLCLKTQELNEINHDMDSDSRNILIV